MTRVAVILGSGSVVAGNAHRGSVPVLPASDRAAVALALERFGGRVDAYCRRDDEEAWRYALAAGAAGAAPLDDVNSFEFDVALVGVGGAGVQGDRFLAQLAERSQGSMVLDVLDIERAQNGNLTVTRDLGRGAREILEVSGTVVLGISESAPRLKYVSRHRRQKVAVPAVSTETASRNDPEPTAAGAWEAVRPRTRSPASLEKTSASASDRMQALLGLAESTGGGANDDHLIVADAATCAQHLLRYLGHHGFIRRSVADESHLHDSTRRVEAPPSSSPRKERKDRSPRGPQRTAEGDSRRGRGPRPVDEEPHG